MSQSHEIEEAIEEGIADEGFRPLVKPVVKGSITATIASVIELIEHEKFIIGIFVLIVGGSVVFVHFHRVKKAKVRKIKNVTPPIKWETHNF